MAISQSTSYFTVFFANTPFKFGSIGSVFTINDDLNDELFYWFQNIRGKQGTFWPNSCHLLTYA
jgi:hypothetical protein